MCNWVWWVAGIVFVVLPELIKAFKVSNDYLCIVNPDGELLLASRQHLQIWWVRIIKYFVGQISRWNASIVLFNWARNTTWKFRFQFTFALFMTFATKDLALKYICSSLQLGSEHDVEILILSHVCTVHGLSTD